MASKSLLSNLLLGTPPVAICSFLLINKKESTSPLDLLTKKKEDKVEESKGEGDKVTEGSVGIKENQTQAGSTSGTSDASTGSTSTSGDTTGVSGSQGQESQVTGTASSGCGCNGWGGVFSDFFD
ncbi:hypothetical protein MHC_04385 [Mycoplasma haemocanis str. Illinois]|uniref:Uncharacterized protein n=1 Tax=Mycoplasma haemocanis (strain Illinois) TaxID=1111676 RepID=H6N7W1_MYCHN|nr:hypothetical protein [Mycoplasma haemocanis]AEW45733.1 hypothetical protein MHC_04385 [Mycoplasma haemocanis str. Illinois]